jgi:hypothetical protein
MPGGVKQEEDVTRIRQHICKRETLVTGGFLQKKFKTPQNPTHLQVCKF